MHSRSFNAVSRSDAHILILGSLPGQMSLAAQQYYAQPYNAFWRIMGELFGASRALPYEERLGRLIQHKIALWDVCHSAARPGSLDSAIDMKSMKPNDFEGFLKAHASIQRICFNGAKAAEIYRRKVLPNLDAALQQIPSIILPSTSPAHAGMRFEQKLKRWSGALTFAL